MEDLRRYILSVLSATIITAITVRLTARQQVISNIIKLICSVFLMCTIISPFVNLKVQDISWYIESSHSEADDIVAYAEKQAITDAEAIIIERTQTYIEDKATEYGAEITAVVSITAPDSLVPDTITIDGEVSPYTRRVLQRIIRDELGIGEEKQIWN